MNLQTKNRVTLWSSNPTPGQISGENYNLEKYMHPNVHSSTIYTSQEMEITQVSINIWTDKEDGCLCAYIYMCVCVCAHMLSHSVVSDFLQPHGL